MKIQEADMGIISNCPLCESHSLHMMTDEIKTRQCINCGHATSDNLHAHYNVDDVLNTDIIDNLSDDMKKWHKIKNNMIWLPSFITLPLGMVFPFADEDENGETMKWGFAPMVEIPKNEQPNFPVEGHKDKFHAQKYDTDNAEMFDEFILALSKMNELAKYLEGN